MGDGASLNPLRIFYFMTPQEKAAELIKAYNEYLDYEQSKVASLIFARIRRDEEATYSQRSFWQNVINHLQVL